MPLHAGTIKCLIAGASLRAALIIYGCVQDAYFDVNYTDIDYDVFSDAAAFMLRGGSPFERSTYRYSPLLAALVIPNVWFREWGKVLFAAADIIAGLLVADLVDDAAGPVVQQWSVALWLFNPYNATISTRGSCDVLVVLMLLAILKWLRDGRFTAAAAMYGLAVHFRIYPIIYAPSIFLFVWHSKSKQQQQVAQTDIPAKVSRYNSFVAPVPLLAYCGLVAAATFTAFTAFFFWLYGETYLQESLLYHLTRKDIRHNFSVYYYHLYLTSGDAATASSALDVGFLAFVPQLLLLLLFSCLYFRHLPMCWMLVTHAFVAFNKVCTAQYFVWYFCLLPVVTQHFKWPPTRGLVTAAVLWLLTQLHWLYWAYRLEFLGQPTFFFIWVAGILFLLANTYLMIQFMVAFVPRRGLNETKVESNKKQH